MPRCRQNCKTNSLGSICPDSKRRTRPVARSAPGISAAGDSAERLQPRIAPPEIERHDDAPKVENDCFDHLRSKRELFTQPQWTCGPGT